VKRKEDVVVGTEYRGQGEERREDIGGGRRGSRGKRVECVY